MAHFAKLDDNNQVIEVHVVANAALDPDNEEQSGIDFLTDWSGGYTNWKQTSYTSSMRYNYAAVGYTYDPIDDAFISPSPDCGHPELELNSQKHWYCSNAAHVVIFDES